MLPLSDYRALTEPQVFEQPATSLARIPLDILNIRKGSRLPSTPGKYLLSHPMKKHSPKIRVSVEETFLAT